MEAAAARGQVGLQGVLSVLADAEAKGKNAAAPAGNHVGGRLIAMFFEMLQEIDRQKRKVDRDDHIPAGGRRVECRHNASQRSESGAGVRKVVAACNPYGIKSA